MLVSPPPVTNARAELRSVLLPLRALAPRRRLLALPVLASPVRSRALLRPCALVRRPQVRPQEAPFLILLTTVLSPRPRRGVSAQRGPCPRGRGPDMATSGTSRREGGRGSGSRGHSWNDWYTSSIVCRNILSNSTCTKTWLQYSIGYRSRYVSISG